MTASASLLFASALAGILWPHPASAPRITFEAPSAKTVTGTQDGPLRVLRAPGSLMILLPASSFRMGSTPEEVTAALVDCHGEPFGHRCDPDLFNHEMPPRQIRLSAFWLDRTEVTVAAYAQCVRAGSCAPVPSNPGARRFEEPSYPRTLVTWQDAADYCAFRGARLPTEAEFERAMRGLAGRSYPWGLLYNSHASNHGRYAWHPLDATDGFSELAPVGSFPSGRTPEGLLDLAGNAREWVSDRYLPSYDERDLVDPQGPVQPTALNARVVRGGSYKNGGPWLRAAARNAAPPELRQPDLGFRCARSEPKARP